MTLTSTQILFLEQVPGVGRSTIIGINDYLTSHKISFPEKDDEIIDLFLEAKQAVKRLKVPLVSDLHLAKETADQIREKSELNDIKLISCFDALFPALLKTIKNKPLLLHCKGDLKSLEWPTVAIIGTREPSEHAVTAGPKLCSYFIQKDFTIVSGLAQGCDTIGHIAAVNENSPTVAVLAGGLHSYYPKENKTLANRILDTGGLLISELPYGTNPHRSTFVNRDRLQSGLSLGVIVLETGIKGGTLHTIGFAIEEKRPVACMYSHLHGTGEFASHEKFQGNKMLVEKGQAVKLNNPESIENYINHLIQVRSEKLIIERPSKEDGHSENNIHPPSSSQLSIF